MRAFRDKEGEEGFLKFERGEILLGGSKMRAERIHVKSYVLLVTL